jgi:glutamate-1-semialdehyde aminotransferase
MASKTASSAPPLNLTKSLAMFEEAKRLSPGGVMGIRRPYNFVVGEYPIFIEKGYGGHIIDVDGNDYIDMLCAYGPIILGYVEPEINDAVKARMDQGFCFSLVQPEQNALEQKLTELIPSAEMVIPVKTGSDATSCAVRIARAYTDRDVILRCGYHGWHDWCVEVPGGVPQAVQDLTVEFHYADLKDLEAKLEAHKGKVAGVIITPVAHPLAADVQAPPPGYLAAVKELAHAHGAVLIFDEIRTGFRVAMGGAQERYGVTPDLTTVGKAMANGYPVAAVVGKREVMQVMEKKAFISSTYFPNSLEMVAALKTIEILQREDVPNSIWERGGRFLDRLTTITAASGVPAVVSGIPPMPFITFGHVDEQYRERRTRFYTECIRRGLFIQPYHHWYIAHRHTDADLARALDVIEEAFGIVAETHPYKG